MLELLEQKYRFFFPKRLANRRKYLDAVKKRSGIEIGGPSGIFGRKGLLPVYDVIDSLDTCNFSNETVWEGKLKEGNFFKFNKNKEAGFQYIADATDLSRIENEKYDVVLSCHNLEHIANPLKALHEWKRIMKQNGYLILVLPLKNKTFDHRRPLTTVTHLVADYENNVQENDETHFEEMMMNHDIAMDTGVNSMEELQVRTFANFQNRCMHHHVFDATNVPEMLAVAGFKVISTDVMYHNIFSLAQKENQL